MQGILDRNLGSKFVFGGSDFNITKYTNSMECVMVENLCSANRLAWCNTKTDSGVDYTFLQRVSIACYAKRCISYRKSVRLSVRPSITGTVSKRLKLRSWGLHCRIAP